MKTFLKSLGKLFIHEFDIRQFIQYTLYMELAY